MQLHVASWEVSDNCYDEHYVVTGECCYCGECIVRGDELIVVGDFDSRVVFN